MTLAKEVKEKITFVSRKILGGEDVGTSLDNEKKTNKRTDERTNGLTDKFIEPAVKLPNYD